MSRREKAKMSTLKSCYVTDLITLLHFVLVLLRMFHIGLITYSPISNANKFDKSYINNCNDNNMLEKQDYIYRKLSCNNGHRYYKVNTGTSYVALGYQWLCTILAPIHRHLLKPRIIWFLSQITTIVAYIVKCT